jgi:hypothetical protein
MGAQVRFKHVTDLGESPSRFVSVYHEAARSSLPSVMGEEGVESCITLLSNFESTPSAGSETLMGFEKRAVEYLRLRCDFLKKEKVKVNVHDS